MRRTLNSIIAITFLIVSAAIVSPAGAQPIQLYWADEFAGRIYKADPDGGNLETIITGDLLNSEEIVFGVCI